MDRARSILIDNIWHASVSGATMPVHSPTNTAHELGETIFAHPTFLEAWMEAAHALRGESIHAAPRRS